MLLPESFGRVAPEAFVAWDETAGAIAGVAAFHRVGRETVRTSVITVRPYRRQGVGSALLRRIVERAAERGDERIHAQVDLAAHPEADGFLHAAGFRRVRIVLEMEGDLGAVREPLLEMRTRLTALKRIPDNVRVADSREFPPDELERIYTALIVPSLGAQAELAHFVVTNPGFDAVILMAGGTPVGILICICNDGHGTGTLSAMAVAPGYRGRGWANLLLLTRAMERGWEAGARRLRLDVDETNLKSLHQSTRLNSVVLRRMADFVYELSAT